MPRHSLIEQIVCDSTFELDAQSMGAQFIAGVDEVGRGALAGPVVAAAVILDFNRLPVGLNDSKKLSARVREKLDAEIRASAIAYAVARIEAEEIDRINILQATCKAMREAIRMLRPAPDFLLLDAVQLKEITIKQKAIIKGDAKSVSIAAASIIAKVARDRWMVDYDQEFPGYGFARNVGYGTASHLQALREIGPSKLHRLTFRQVLPEAQPLFDQ
ncbi:MAG: ribonuclease HII [Acidobacteria bacterium]|nr:ribonuclease HII [Acidobacteriota bacterium]